MSWWTDQYVRLCARVSEWVSDEWVSGWMNWRANQYLYACVSEWEKEWVCGWAGIRGGVNECVSEWVSEWMSESVRGWGWVAERISKYVRVSLYVSVSKRVREGVNEWVSGWVSEGGSELVCGRVTEWVSEWMMFSKMTIGGGLGTPELLVSMT